MQKENLTDEYVNLYRQLWLSNNGLWTEDLMRMSKSEIKKEIKEMQKAIKEKNSYYPGLCKN